MDEDVSVPFIQLNNVSKVYHMGETDVAALSGVTLTIDEDSFTVVVGRSGSGKSTLLHLLAAMDVPTAGEITVVSGAASGVSDVGVASASGIEG